MTATDPTAAIEAVYRIEFPRLVAGLARYVDDIGLAEELAQDALVAALEQWPRDGTPSNPGAWLMTVSKRKAIDRIRRDQTFDAKRPLLAVQTEGRGDDAGFRDDLDQAPIEDDRLRLLFVACHPVLSVPSRIALALRFLGGLSTAEIGRAFLQSESTVATRLSRAKNTIGEAGVPFEVPAGRDRAERLASVLEVIYLIFNEGYAATTGDDWMRPDLCAEALRLGRLLAALSPDDPEVHGLLALMELHSSRLTARVGPDQEPVLLLDQDRRSWDRLLITRGVSSLERAGRLTDAPGPYALQAAIAACHARAQSVEQTDWGRIAALYDALAQTAPSPVITLNRAVAVAMAFGPLAGLEVIDTLRDEPSLNNYHLLPSVRGDLLVRLDRFGEARTEFERAAKLTRNARERVLLLDRAMRCCKESIGPAQ